MEEKKSLRVPEKLPPITEELLQMFRNVPATVEGMLEFIDKYDASHLRAFTKYMTPEQREAYAAALEIIMKDFPIL